MFRPLNVRREGLEVIYRAYGMLQAEAIKGRLEASGIPALLDFESIGQTFGIAVDGLGGRKKIAALAEKTVRRGFRRALSGGPSAASASKPGAEHGDLTESAA